ncbi:glycosyltransferase family 2 protein [Sphingomonas aurantiaca]|uniref:glycosyltransferase n=1 Tax=Sphingomonas aurantiaca TaxID=185949 RepID=UPI002FE241D3
MWHALTRDDAHEGRQTKAIVLHDAEDVVHPHELRVFDSLIDRYDVVQLPVLPLVHHGARLVSGHYADEFAEPLCALTQLTTNSRKQPFADAQVSVWPLENSHSLSATVADQNTDKPLSSPKRTSPYHSNHNA